MADDIRTTLTLVQKAKAGEGEALNLLFDRYVPRILRIVRMRIGSGLRGRMESMDVVQDVMIRAIRAFDQFEAKDEAAFLHWISKLVQNEIRDLADYHNAEKRNVGREVTASNESTDNRSVLSQIPADSMYRPSFQVRLKEDVLQLETALDQLPEKQKEVIIMRQYEGMSFKDIGEKIECSEDAARMQFARAMDRLTDLMTHG